LKAVKKFFKNKYFSMAIFGLLLVISIFALHLTIKHDVQNAAIPDDMTRVTGKVTEVYGHSMINADGTESVQYDIVVYVKLDDGKVYEGVPINDAPKCNEGDKITLKYAKGNEGIFFLANDPQPNYRIVNYILWASLVILSIAGLIMSSKIIDILDNRRKLALKIEEEKKYAPRTADGIEYNSTGAYEGYDGSEKGNVDLNPFADNNIDYNAIYEYDKKLDDASYSATGTYQDYNSGYVPPNPPPNSNNPMDKQYDPFATYSGYDESESDDPYQS